MSDNKALYEPIRASIHLVGDDDGGVTVTLEEDGDTVAERRFTADEANPERVLYRALVELGLSDWPNVDHTSRNWFK